MAVLHADTTPAQLENQIIPDIAALPSVVSVPGDTVSGIGPSEIFQEGAVCNLYVTSQLGGVVSGGTGETFNRMSRAQTILPVTPSRKWAVVTVIVPDTLNEGEINQLQSEIGGVTGVNLSRHLTDGLIPDRQETDSMITVSAHMRIEVPEVV